MLANTDLGPLGWAFLLVSTISVTWVTYWCFKKVLTGSDDAPPAGHIGLGP